MIIQENKSTLKQSQAFQSVSFGIKREGLAHIFNVLRNQLYSDKVLAVIREYSANAIDAHVESGKKDRPIVVTLPNPLNLAFKVRDFGLGLSEQQVRDIYANYGESTKRGTNEQIGQLGLGSKSAFAYGENFLIRSFQNGIVSLYNAFIDPTQIGQIAKLHSNFTDEEDGIEIEIPVNERDIYTFKTKAEGLFKYFKIKPIVNGNNEYIAKSERVFFAGSDFRFVDSESSSVFAKHGVVAVALMGNIAYPITPDAINWGEEVELKKILQRQIVIDFNIGDLEVSASREALQYTPHTQKNIIAKAKSIKEECLAEVRSKLTKGSSMYEAKIVYNNIFDYYSGYSLNFLSGILKKDDLKFKGKEITSGTWDVRKKGVDGYHALVQIFKVKQSRRYGSKDKVSGDWTSLIDAAKDAAYVIKDIKSSILTRIAPLCELDNNHLGRKFKNVFLIEPKEGFDQWAKDNQFDAPTVKLSELPKVSLKDLGYVTKSSDGTAAVNEKHNVQVFSVNYQTNYTNIKSDYFTPVEVDMNAGGVWFEIDRFVPTDDPNSYGSTASYIKTIASACTLLGLDKEKVIAVKVSNSEEFKSNKNWKTVKQWISENLQKYLDTQKIEQKFSDRQEFLKTINKDTGAYCVHTMKMAAIINDDSEMKTFANHLNQMKNDKFDSFYDKIKNISDWTNVEIKTVKPTHDIMTEWKNVKAKYPMYMMVEGYKLGWSNNDATNKAIADYINMVDATVGK